jgi:hypothetical protein
MIGGMAAMISPDLTYLGAFVLGMGFGVACFGAIAGLMALARP